MDLTNNDKIGVMKMPVKNTQTKSMPTHSSVEGGECRFTGVDTGVNGRMGDYSSGVTNTE